MSLEKDYTVEGIGERMEKAKLFLGRHRVFDSMRFICKECKGGCCSDWPYYYKGECGKIHSNGITLRINEHGTPVISAKPGSCYYYERGGCHPQNKPRVCKDSYCTVVRGFLFPDGIMYGKDASKTESRA